jgi:hypothetical protein
MDSANDGKWRFSVSSTEDNLVGRIFNIPGMRICFKSRTREGQKLVVSQAQRQSRKTPALSLLSVFLHVFSPLVASARLGISTKLPRQHSNRFWLPSFGGLSHTQEDEYFSFSLLQI